MLKYQVEAGHADYIFKVVGPNGISFHIKDRYSSMRSFQSLLKKEIDDKSLSSLP